MRPVDPDWPVAKESLVYIQREKNFLSFCFEEDSGCTRGLYSMNTTYPLEIGNLVQHYGTWVPRVRFACVDKQSSVDYRDCHMPEHFRRWVGLDWIRSHDLLRIEVTPGMWRIRPEVVFWYRARGSTKCHST